MRILQICSASDWGGGEAHVADLVRALVERGHAVYLAVRPNSPLREPLAGLITSWHEIPLRNSLDVQSSRAIADLILHHGIDVVHAHVGRDYLVAALACRRAGRAKLVLTRHHYLPLKQNAVYRWLLRDVSAVIAVSKSVQQSVSQRLDLPADRIHVIPNWVDQARFQALDRDAARAIFRVKAKLCVGYIGQISPAKGIEELVRAAGRVSRMRSDVEFVIAGEEQEPDAPFTTFLLDLAAKLGIARRISFIGYVGNVPDLLAAVDLVVVPSWDEGFSLVAVEALAARRALLASDVGGIRDIVKDSVTGMLFPPRDSNALANKLLWMLSDSPMRERLAGEGQRDVLKRFGREQVVTQIESLYLSVLDSGQPEAKV